MKTPDAKKPGAKLDSKPDGKPDGKAEGKLDGKPVINPAEAAGADLDGKQSSVRRPVTKTEARKFQPARKTQPPRAVTRKVTP